MRLRPDDNDSPAVTLPVAPGRRWWPAAGRLGRAPTLQGVPRRRRAGATPLGHARRRRIRHKGAVPIEVKIGPTARLRNLHLILREYPQWAAGLRAALLRRHALRPDHGPL